MKNFFFLYYNIKLIPFKKVFQKKNFFFDETSVDFAYKKNFFKNFQKKY